MFFDFWSWLLVIIIVAVIFYANKLPQLKEQAEEQLQKGKVLLEKSKKELEAKAVVLAEKAKEKQKAEAEKKAEEKQKTEAFEEESEITVEDLEFMPKENKETVSEENKKQEEKSE